MHESISISSRLKKSLGVSSTPSRAVSVSLANGVEVTSGEESMDEFDRVEDINIICCSA